jgi:hypothetical protein
LIPGTTSWVHFHCGWHCHLLLQFYQSLMSFTAAHNRPQTRSETTPAPPGTCSKPRPFSSSVSASLSKLSIEHFLHLRCIYSTVCIISFDWPLAHIFWQWAWDMSMGWEKNPITVLSLPPCWSLLL